MEHTPLAERELKFGSIDHDRLRERLRELGGERRAPSSFEDNEVFDRGGELAGAGRILRLRIDRQGTKLTYKDAASFEGGVKIRTEIETAIAQADSLRAILEALGYAVVRRYQKYREDWTVGSIVVSLDRTPIGDYAEFEGEGCERVARRCGLDPDDAEPRNYLKIYEDYLEEHPGAPPQMVFS